MMNPGTASLLDAINTTHSLVIGSRYVFAASLGDAIRGNYSGRFLGRREEGRAVFFAFDGVKSAATKRSEEIGRPDAVANLFGGGAVWVNTNSIQYLIQEPAQEQEPEEDANASLA